MAYADWTDADWQRLIKDVRTEAPISLSDSEIREAAWHYMVNGPDGGGNRWGLEGTMVALSVDKVNEQARG